MPSTDLRIYVCGLGHLGTVTAACLAEHFTTIAYDSDSDLIAHFRAGKSPVSEPGLDEALKAGKPAFSDDLNALKDADLVWFTYETPVNDDDIADVAFIDKQMAAIIPHLPKKALVLISSQVPVGFTARCEKTFPGVSFAYSPENLQLGRAMDAFRKPQRIVVGARDEAAKKRLAPLLKPFCERIEWMSVESAEMTKHALNAFLATSVAFINELAELCEKVGADPKEVERGLKSEARIGPKAYLRPGAAFAGGTLARDLNFLTALGGTTLFPAVLASNDNHKGWPRRRLQSLLKDLSGKTVAVWGLSYKPGTDSIRRSEGVELCRWLVKQGATVQAFDPAVKKLPADLKTVRLSASPEEALKKADALVVATEWPEFKKVRTRVPVTVDAGGFLS